MLKNTRISKKMDIKLLKATKWAFELTILPFLKAKRTMVWKWKPNLLTSNEAFRSGKLSVDISLNYSLTDNFTLIQITVSILEKKKVQNTEGFYVHQSKYETIPGLTS